MRKQPGRADGDAGIAGHRRHPEMQTFLAASRLGEPGLIEMFEQPHVADGVECDTAGQHHPVGAGRAQQVIHDVDHGILEHELCGRRLVEAILRIGAMLDVLDP